MRGDYVPVTEMLQNNIFVCVFGYLLVTDTSQKSLSHGFVMYFIVLPETCYFIYFKIILYYICTWNLKMFGQSQGSSDIPSFDKISQITLP